MTASTCRRCGTCCRGSGPTLHLADLPLVRAGHLGLDQLLTLRAGEMVHDQIRGTLRPLASEIIKLRWQADGHTCLFYQADPVGCANYGHRPLECRLLDCRNTAPLAAMYEQERLTRAHLLPPESALGQLVADHEAQCALATAISLRRQALSGNQAAARELAGLLDYDAAVRDAVAERMPASGGTLELLFGRPLKIVLEFPPNRVGAPL